MARQGKFHTIMTQKAANGAGTSIQCGKALYAIVQVATESSAGPVDPELVLKFVGSASATEPTWASAAAVDNIYDYKMVISQDDLTPIVGSTGIVMSGSGNIIKEYKVNTDEIEWLNAVVSGYVSGKVTVKVKLCNDSRFK